MGVCGPDVETTLEILDDTAVAKKLESQSSSESESSSQSKSQSMSDSGSVSNSESESGSFSESNSQSLSTSTSESTSDSQSDSTSTSTSDSASTSASLSGSSSESESGSTSDVVNVPDLVVSSGFVLENVGNISGSDQDELKQLVTNMLQDAGIIGDVDDMVDFDISSLLERGSGSGSSVGDVSGNILVTFSVKVHFTVKIPGEDVRDDVVAEEEKEGVWVDIDQECPDGKVPLLDQDYCLEIHEVDGASVLHRHALLNGTGHVNFF